jgi:hypothetical protein
MSWKDDPYDVGYGKPPKSSQFQKGRSGNPNGRPRGTRNFFTDLEEVLSKKVTVVENGKKKKTSAQMATIQRLCEKALMGDQRSIALLLSLAEQLANEKEMQGAEKALSASDVQILNNFADSLATKTDSSDQSDKEEGNVD